MNKQLIAAVFLSAILSGVSCKKANNTIETDRTVTAGGPSGAPGTCGETTITGVISSNMVLSSCKIYKLVGLVYVVNNATLTIEAGTLIKGVKGVSGAPGGGLIVTRGSKLIANGTASNPIVFTSDENVPASGDWSGVVLLGKAPTNYLTPTIVEGISPNPPVDATFGGPFNQDANDNSGILKYVRIEYAGYELSPDNELNGLTLAGVGKGTILDYIEVYKSRDDAFEFFGGTVNASHLIAIDALDDMFDTDKGYTGTISYALGLVDINRADKSTSNGLESDNDQSSSPVNPITHPVYNNITIIGLPTAAAASSTNRPPSGTGRYGNAATLRKRAQFDINRSVFMGFNCGIFLEETNPGPSTYSYYVDGISTLNNNFVHGFVNAFCKNSGGFTPIETTNIGYVGPDPNAGIKLNAPFLRNNFSNFAPATGSPVQTAGAFPLGNTAWANGWARL